ncbi:hypothetical protein LTS18_002966 [Coniosporium uncinatum]|uniref:Uncharacterized protein n=1 Tax=Coniosporium uncinatum TaxID=93489 RepID=A0ACC3DBK1_9PEZI|nr:hypothetical protein LTS18_002966 [Coniosporium uncinatum]
MILRTRRVVPAAMTGSHVNQSATSFTQTFARLSGPIPGPPPQAFEELQQAEPEPHLHRSEMKRLMRTSRHSVESSTQIPITSLLSSWWFEFASWYLSALCLAAVLVILVKYDHKPVPFLPFGITINAIISVLSGVVKSALLVPIAEAIGQLKWNWFRGTSRDLADFEVIDEASRGPWGSLVLLLRTRLRSMACLGAAITVLIIALDPFFQQIVIISTRVVALDDGSYAETPRSIFYSVENVTALEMYPDGTSAAVQVQDDNMQAILQPLFFVEKLTIDEDGNAIAPNLTACGWYLNATSDRPVLMNGYALEPNSTEQDAGLSMRILLISFDVTTKESYYNGSVLYSHIRNPIMDFIIVSSPNGASDVYLNKTPVALECALSWCVNRINATSTLGIYREEVLESFQTDPNLPFPWIIDEEASTAHYNSNITITPEPPNNGTTSFGTASTTAFLVMLNFYQALFPSYITSSNASSPDQLRAFNIAVPTVPEIRKLRHKPWLKSSASLMKHMDEIAKAMTHTVRSANEGSDRWRGSALQLESYVDPRWEWLSLPALLIVCGLTFLILTVLDTSRRNDRIGIWKTSALAVLLNGVRDNNTTNIGNPSHFGRKGEKCAG